MVSKAERTEAYANWLTSNTDKRDTDEFKTVADAYKKLRQEDRQPGSAQRLVYGINRGLGVDALGRGLESLGLDVGDTFDRFTGGENVNIGRAGRAGETIGKGLQVGLLAAPFAPAGAAMLASPIGTATTAQRVAGSLTAPLATKAGAAAEVGASVGAGLGTSFAENQDLGDAGKAISEFTGAVIGGTGGMLGAAARTAGSVGSGVKRAIGSKLDPNAGSKMASEEARRVIFEEGGNPDQIARTLRGADENVRSPFLASDARQVLGMQQALASQDKKFAQNIAERVNKDIKGLSRQIQQVRTTGDPADFATAAESRAAGFEAVLDRWVKSAEERANSTAGALKVDGEGRANLSRQARDIVETAIKNARDEENRLFNSADLGQKIDASPIMSVVKSIEKDEMFQPSKALRGVLRAGATRFAKKDKKKNVKPVEAKKVQAFRSEVLSLAREARSKNNFSEARRLNEIADAALDTMNGVNGLDDALAYSRALNDVYRRSVIGRITGRADDGRLMIEPSRTLEATVRGTPETKALAVEDLIKGAGGVRGESPEQSAEMQGLVERFALSLSGTVNPQTGRVNASKLSNFVSQNDRLFQSLPGLKGRLINAQGAEELLGSIERASPGLKDRFRKKVFGQLLARKSADGPIEDPALIVKSALEGATPRKDFYQLVRTANKGGQKAKDGLRVSLFDHAFGNTGRISADNISDQAFDPSKALQRLNQPLSNRQGVTLLDEMIKTKLISKQQKDVLIAQLNRLNNFVQKSAESEALGVELVTSDKFLETMSRLAGSNLATMGSFTSSSSLIMGYEGSKRMREFILDMPAGKMKKALTEAMTDKDALADLLTLTQTKAPQRTNIASFSEARQDASERLFSFFAKIFGLNKMPPLAAMQQAIEPITDQNSGLYFEVQPGARNE